MTEKGTEPVIFESNETNEDSVVKDVVEFEDRISIRMSEHKPVTISSEKEYRKGIEIDICDGCNAPKSITLWEYNESFCSECTWKKLEVNND